MSVRTRKLLMVAYRVLLIALVGLILGSFVIDRLGESPYPRIWLGLGAALVVVLMLLRSGMRNLRPVANRPPVEVLPPVTGRWSAVNSPADKVPSHGTHGYGQTYAIDIVAEPEPGDGPARPGFAWVWPPVCRSDAFPAYGAPLLAVADGTVVHASDNQRDHLSRNSLPMLAYLLLIESTLRETLGAARIVGNHIVLDLGDGTYAMYAHVQQGSLKIRAGDTVEAGTPLAACGNSGNSTEPHVHFQLMNSPDLDTARGIPFTWRDIGVPSNGETFTVPAPTPLSPAP
ncbi:peptidoglycan DD-metalloendopeptidase family protein [Streptomyces sp. NPDC058001]|uniref:M23 family metallopeptidase n=1 Tax=Streptomyces sp. NPDC058001 TaxID=3346300 RepID=UPI0036E975E2